MADKIRIEIGGRLAPMLLRLAREQGRAPDEIAEEALGRYLRELGVEAGPDLGRPVEELHVRSWEEEERLRRAPLPSLLGRMSSRFDLDEDEAMRIAVEEQHAYREERAARRRAEG